MRKWGKNQTHNIKCENGGKNQFFSITWGNIPIKSKMRKWGKNERFTGILKKWVEMVKNGNCEKSP